MIKKWRSGMSISPLSLPQPPILSPVLIVVVRADYFVMHPATSTSPSTMSTPLVVCVFPSSSSTRTCKLELWNLLGRYLLWFLYYSTVSSNVPFVTTYQTFPIFINKPRFTRSPRFIVSSLISLSVTTLYSRMVISFLRIPYCGFRSKPSVSFHIPIC